MQEEQTQQPTVSPTPPDTNWAYNDESIEGLDQPTQKISSVNWTASEFIEYEKTNSWFLALAVGAVALVLISFLLTRDIVTVVVIAVTAILFGVLAARKPRTMQYGVDDHGISIGRNLHPYHEFKSFSVTEEGALHSVILLPAKRFLPTITIYFEPKDEEKILDTISTFLPFQEHQPNIIDRLMERIRF
ncbi:MAG: hypothetical protein AAB459_03895 [Patescibacteria group bacterium]